MADWSKFYLCDDGCHVVLTAMTIATMGEGPAHEPTIACTIMSRYQREPIRDRATGVDRWGARRVEFSMREWMTLHDQGFREERLTTGRAPACWEERIHAALGAHVLAEAEVRSAPVGVTPYAI